MFWRSPTLTSITFVGVDNMFKFISGFLVCSSIHSLYQDWLGKEVYLALVDARWVSWKVSVPEAIACIIVAILIYNTEITFKKSDLTKN